DKTFTGLDAIGIDLIKNGRIQKFEYSTELAWKVSKIYLELEMGIMSHSPKEVYRLLFREKKLDEKQLQALLKTIDNRNRLSHIYHEEMYDIIYEELPEHLEVLEDIVLVLKNNTP